MAVFTKFLNLLKPQPNDFINVEEHLGKNYDKIDEGVEKISNEKLDKGLVSEEYDTAKKIEDKIKDIHDKFKNLCPYAVGDIYITTNSTNPSSIYLGTTWQKIEGKFLLGSSSSYQLNSDGGNSTVTLSVDNLPSHTHNATTASHSHTQPEHKHTLTSTGSDFYTYYGKNYIYTVGNIQSYRNGMVNAINSAGGETTGASSPITTISNTGNNREFSIMPPYLVVNIWKRLN